MLSFEEFFIKKKIDLFALKSADPALYTEFEAHYSAMGEKSFDHTKKFWFNKLRKSYLLADVPVAPVAPVEKSSNTVAASKTTTANPKLGFKPKFAAKTVVEATNSTEGEQKTTVATGFKPRFKAGVTKTTEPKEAPATAETSESKEIETKPAATKPAGFKPRFKAGVTKTTEAKEAPATAEATEQQETETKPTANKPAGFKPRFKAGVTKTAEPKEAPATTEASESKETETKPAANKPAGFKPRFKAGVTKTTPPAGDTNNNE